MNPKNTTGADQERLVDDVEEDLRGPLRRRTPGGRRGGGASLRRGQRHGRKSMVLEMT